MLLQSELLKQGYTLILASKSPRRKFLLCDELLRGSGVECRTAEYEVCEDYPEDLAADQVAEYLSRVKSDAYPEPLSEREMLITADTIVVVDNQILGKPSSRDDARTMLRLLSGREHRVLSGVTLRSGVDVVSFTECTKVRFAELSDDVIDYYVDSYAPLDKAGAYGIQEWIGYSSVIGIEGCYFNVMGLPTQRLYSEMVGLVTK